MSEMVLKISCDDRIGIVAKVSTYLAQAGCNILDAQQFDDRSNKRFFMRVAFEQGQARKEILEQNFKPIAQQFNMEWMLRSRAVPPKVLILVSKLDHCLLDLLYRKRIGELDMEVVGVVSNHPRRGSRSDSIQGVPFFHFPIGVGTKKDQEWQIRTLVKESQAELVVLARYMQILSPEFAVELEGRCINIHHSFLPGFKGARPYHQAFDRGVKMIGATSHYVNSDLDEGPIIAQDVKVISHRHQPEDLIAIGRDVERRVLAAAVKAHLEDRVFLNGNRTVVLES